jgi:hypothetical protein
LKAYENKIVNFHPSILPSFKGLKAIDAEYSFLSLVFSMPGIKLKYKGIFSIESKEF